MGLFEKIEAAKRAEARATAEVNRANAERDQVARAGAHELAKAEQALHASGGQPAERAIAESVRRENIERIAVARKRIVAADARLRAARDKRNALLSKAGQLIAGR